MYNLLLVDDEPLIKVAFQSAVEWGKNGFLLAATASNGQEALHIVETQHIDAVITDLKMPGMDGLALIHELKKRSFTGPILVLSNYSDFDSVRTALTDGAYDYFLKINMNGESMEATRLSLLISPQISSSWVCRNTLPPISSKTSVIKSVTASSAGIG